MAGSLRITVLVDDVPADDIPGEHGWSAFVECDGGAFLFDTGQTDLFAHNAMRLGVDLARASHIVLSHGHYDHTGGLDAALSLLPGAAVVAHPSAFVPRYAVDRAEARSIGSPLGGEAVRSAAGRLVLSPQPVELPCGGRTTGQIPRRTDFEHVADYFRLEGGGRGAGGAGPHDPIPDDMAVVAPVRDGLLLLCGCTHSGIVNTIMHVRDMYPGEEIVAVIGGLHMIGASDERIARTLDFLEEMGPPEIWPAHCTGTKAAEAMARRFPDRTHPCRVGTTVELPAR